MFLVIIQCLVGQVYRVDFALQLTVFVQTHALSSPEGHPQCVNKY
jgi:hypothetical protein